MGYERTFTRSHISTEVQLVSDPSLAKLPAATESQTNQFKRGRASFELAANERWYAVYAQPRRETTVEAHLCRQGFRAFVPRHEKTVRHARKMRILKVPVFPRYLFVILDLERDRWRSINGTFGVTSLVMAQDCPLPLPKGLVEYLIQSTDENGLFREESNLQPGQLVRVRTGPFAEAFGVLSRLNGSARVDVLIQFMSGDVRLNVLREWVEPAGEC